MAHSSRILLASMPVDACTYAPWIVSREMNLRVLSGAALPSSLRTGIGWVSTLPQFFKKISATGGTTVTLCPAIDARGATWGPDDTIVFADPVGMMKVSAAGGVPKPVTTLKGKEISHSWPQHLPGGSLVLFTSYESTDYDRGRIEVVNLKTGSRKVVHSGGTFGRYAASGHLLYIQRNTVYAAPFDVARLEITAKAVPVLEHVMMNGRGGAHYDVSPDGKLGYLTGQDALALSEAIVLGRAGWQADLNQRKAPELHLAGHSPRWQAIGSHNL